MLANYLKIAFRNLMKNKLFSVINILGMSISLTSVFIIALFVFDEMKYDAHIEDADRKFRFYNSKTSDTGENSKLAVLPYPLATYIQKDLPEVESTLRIMSTFGDNLFEANGKQLQESNGVFAEGEITNMLSLKFIDGDPTTAFEKPDLVVLNRSTAEKYFGTSSAVGNVIKISKTDYTVSGVIENLPTTSHLQVDYLLSFPSLTRNWAPIRFENWVNQQYITYVKLKPGTDPQAFESKVNDLIDKYSDPQTKPQGFEHEPHIQNIKDIHLTSTDFQWDVAVAGNAQTVYILSITAVLILVIACLNFINLSTARSIKRMKEVGVRKVVGALKSQLILQFVMESIVITGIALFIAVTVTSALLPSVNSFAEKSIHDPFTFTTLALLAVAAIALGFIAGSYPAFHLSRFRPATILSNKGSAGSNSNVEFFRKGLVVVQFAFSFFLIISAMIVLSQNDYLKNKDLGFDKEQLVVLQLSSAQRPNVQALKHEYANHPNILDATLSYGLPGDIVAGDGITDAATGKPWGANMILADEDYIKTFGMTVVAGRDFSKDSPSDLTNAFILNEEAVKAYGYGTPDDAIGKKVDWQIWGTDSTKHGEVIGVVKDFHIRNFREKITPLVMHIGPQYFFTLTLRVKPENIRETIAHLADTWKKADQEWPFNYKFIDENFDKMYKNEEKLSALLSAFTLLAILIACMGLFGLVEYSVNQRAKEISIRKIFGAATSSLLILLTKQYFALIAIAFVIIIPVSYYTSLQWLEGFVYHIKIDPFIFVKAGAMIVGITVLTVMFQSLRAASSNPAKVLRSE
ncbi:MAG TPA: ABC transporter permease [Chryseosolibacter sp.]